MQFRNKAFGGAVLALMLATALHVPAFAQANIDFGDDSSQWAKDGECDDPRFEGTGMAAELEDIDIKKDATDCKAAIDAGTVTLKADKPAETPAATAPADIDFGDDSGDWAKDGECDDPRFAGTGMAAELEDADIGKDATDCKAAFDAGTVTLAGDSADTAAIDFGDDSGDWPNDGECDDPRFAGSAMASELDDSQIGKDASDCKAAFDAGTVALAGDDDAPPASTIGSAALAAIAGRIDFGDDSGDWPNDGECDDPDFIGSNVADSASDANRLKDASDCKAAFLAGNAALKSGADLDVSFNYGTDSSQWANDGQCDDLRFAGPGMAKKLDIADVEGDATDCSTLEADGQVWIRPVYTPEYAANAPYDSSDVEFGDDSSSYANDGQCDDPRFEGPGTASTLLEDDRMKDAADCRAAYEAGTITLRE